MTAAVEETTKFWKLQAEVNRTTTYCTNDHEGPQAGTRGKENTFHGWELTACLKSGSRLEGTGRPTPWLPFHIETEELCIHFPPWLINYRVQQRGFILEYVIISF